MLDKLKESGNQLYIDVSSPSEYQKRCKETDKTGYQVVYSDDEDLVVCQTKQKGVVFNLWNVKLREWALDAWIKLLGLGVIWLWLWRVQEDFVEC